MPRPGIDCECRLPIFIAQLPSRSIRKQHDSAAVTVSCSRGPVPETVARGRLMCRAAASKLYDLVPKHCLGQCGLFSVASATDQKDQGFAMLLLLSTEPAAQDGP